MPEAFADPPAASPRPRLAPPPEGDPRPLWSVMIPTFNCARFLEETLASVLAQDPGPAQMQIEVVDDASTLDDPEDVVRRLGSGRVGFHRQPANLGHHGNFRTCLARSRGRLIHLLHGDDRVRPGFYARMAEAFEREPAIGAAFCRHRFIDGEGRVAFTSDVEREDSGVLDGWLERIALRQRIQTPSMVVRREIYETLGVFDRRLSAMEDWEMWIRIAAHHPVWYEAEALADYRMHAASYTGRLLRTGENLRDVRRAWAIIATYLPPKRARRLRAESLAHWADNALRYRVPDMLQRGDLRAAGCQIREALTCSRAPAVLAAAAALIPGVIACAARAAAAPRADASPARLRHGGPLG